MSVIRHLPPWLLPGYRRSNSNRSPTEGRTWKDKYETEENYNERHASFTSTPPHTPLSPSVASPASPPHLLPFPAPLPAAIPNSPAVVGFPPLSLVPLSVEPGSLYSPPDVSESHDCSAGGCQRVVINVSGQRFETQRRTLDRFPDTLLGDPLKRRRYWDTRRSEFFIDRHRASFQAILYYYQSGGRLRRPFEVPEDVFLEEMEFYGLGENTIQEYKEKEGFVMEKKMLLPKRSWQRRLWLFCEEPDSSLAARVFAVVAIICILASITNFCMETLPAFDRPICLNSTTEPFRLVPNYHDPFFLVESICVTWFTGEFILRLISCPCKWTFCKDIMNIFDVLAIVPFFIILIIQQTDGNCESAKKSGSFVFIRVLRVFRIFKLSKHSQGLRILGLTIKTSLHELGMFFFFLLVAMVIFSSAAYYAEAGEDDSQLKSIPGAFWWAIVTMTTVGYGDVTPIGVWGKLVGTLCVIAGVLTIALPVPVVVANFNNFYRHENGRGGYLNG